MTKLKNPILTGTLNEIIKAFEEAQKGLDKVYGQMSIRPSDPNTSKARTAILENLRSKIKRLANEM